MAFKTGSGATLKTAITNNRVIQGNLTGRSGSWDTAASGSVLQVRLDLSTGNVFDVNPVISPAYTYLSFRFINYTPRKKIEFYLLWQNYKDSYNNSNYTFNYVFTSGGLSTQEVRFPGGATTLNNANAGLFDGRTQIFKFNTISGGEIQSVYTTPPAWFGSLYMKNCPPNSTPKYI